MGFLLGLVVNVSKKCCRIGSQLGRCSAGVLLCTDMYMHGAACLLPHVLCGMQSYVSVAYVSVQLVRCRPACCGCAEQAFRVTHCAAHTRSSFFTGVKTPDTASTYECVSCQYVHALLRAASGQ